jgi:hypothetical protein
MVNKAQNFLMRGKLGDFIQSLFALKNLCKQNTYKANLFMYDLPSGIGWERGIETTYSELYDILITQPYINSFSILKGSVDNYIDLGDFIHSPLLYKACWSEIFSNQFCFSIDKEYRWLEYSTVDQELTDKVLIHHRAKYGSNEDFPYSQIIEDNPKKVIFISTDVSDYMKFPYKDQIEFLKIDTMDDWFRSINSCATLISNISAPACIANALDVPRVLELPSMIDARHWMGEEKYSSNMFWYYDTNINFLPS